MTWILLYCCVVLPVNKDFEKTYIPARGAVKTPVAKFKTPLVLIAAESKLTVCPLPMYRLLTPEKATGATSSHFELTYSVDNHIFFNYVST